MATQNTAAAKQAVMAKSKAAPKSLTQQIKEMIPQIGMALPEGLDAERIARIILTEVRKNPELQNCDPKSFFGAVMNSAQLGLEVGSHLGLAYLVPYKRNVTLIIGYKGLVELVYRSGQVSLIKAIPIYENEPYEWDGESVGAHKPLPPSKRGKNIIAVYARATMKDGNKQYELMWKEEIDSIRDRSQAGKNGPWVTDYIEMAKKTVLKRMTKMLPMSVEAQRSIASDEMVFIPKQDPVSIFEEGAEVVNESTGEITSKV